MNKRGIAQAIGAIKRQATIDIDFSISKTPFKIIKTFKKMSSYVLTHDVMEGAEPLKPKLIEAYSYDRLPYMSITFDAIDKIKGLSAKAYKLFKYIIVEIPIGSNVIKLTTKDIGKIIDDKYPSNVSKVLHELLDNNLIGKSEDFDSKDKYVINHNLCFKGNYNQFINKLSKIDGKSTNPKNADD